MSQSELLKILQRILKDCSKTQMIDFQGFIKKVFSKSNPARWAAWLVLAFLTVAIFGNIITHEPHQNQLPALIPYASTTLDSRNSDYVGPLSIQDISSFYYRHWLGTDQIGRDVLAGLVAGTRVALAVGFGGMSLSLLFGFFLGLSAGYFGDKGLKMTKMGLILRGLVLGLALFYTLVFIQQKISLLWIFLFLIAILLIIKYLEIKFLSNLKKISIPVDTLIMRGVEIMQGVPTILWLLCMVSVMTQLNVSQIILLIGFTGWMSFTRLVRGEMLRIRHLEYMDAAKVLGLSDLRIIIRHALPNILTPILTAASFGIANSILLESTISFIGLGLPPDQVTWGTMLNAARGNFSAWWLAVFPGMMIFITVFAFNKLGESLNRNRQLHGRI
jgi:peptide/nickel transport system permease protein